MITTAALARRVLAGTLTLGLLAGCGGGEKPEALPSSTPAPDPTPSVYVVGGKGYSITFPEKPKHSKEEAKRGLKLTTDVYTLRTEDANFSVSRVSYAGHDVPSLRSALNSAAAQTGGRLTSSRTFTYRGEPGIQGTIKGTLKSDREAEVFIRYIVVDKKILIGLIYVPNTKPTKDTKRIRDAFLGSLKFETPKNDQAEAAEEDTGDADTGGPLPG